MIALKILAFLLMGAGTVIVFGARWLVSKYNLDQRVTCDFENELSDEELALYKNNKAVVNMKMLGMLVVLPGLVMILLLFR